MSTKKRKLIPNWVSNLIVFGFGLIVGSLLVSTIFNRSNLQEIVESTKGDSIINVIKNRELPLDTIITIVNSEDGKEHIVINYYSCDECQYPEIYLMPLINPNMEIMEQISLDELAYCARCKKHVKLHTYSEIVPKDIITNFNNEKNEK